MGLLCYYQTHNHKIKKFFNEAFREALIGNMNYSFIIETLVSSTNNLIHYFTKFNFNKDFLAKLSFNVMVSQFSISSNNFQQLLNKNDCQNIKFLIKKDGMRKKYKIN